MPWNTMVNEIVTPGGEVIHLQPQQEMNLGAKLCGLDVLDPNIHRAHLSVELLSEGSIQIMNWDREIGYKLNANDEMKTLGRSQSVVLPSGSEFTLQGQDRRVYKFQFRTRAVTVQEMEDQRAKLLSDMESIDRALQEPLPTPEPLSGRKRSHSDSDSDDGTAPSSPIPELSEEPERKRTCIKQENEDDQSMVVLARPEKPNSTLQVVWRTESSEGVLEEVKERRSSDGLRWYTYYGPVEDLRTLRIGVLIGGGFQWWRKERFEPLDHHCVRNRHFAYYTPTDKRYYAKDCASFFMWIQEQGISLKAKLEACEELRRFIKKSDTSNLRTTVLMYVNHLLEACAPGENNELNFPLFLYMLGCILSAFQQPEPAAVTLWETNYFHYLSILAFIGQQHTLEDLPLFLLKSSSDYDMSALERIMYCLTPSQWKNHRVNNDDLADVGPLKLILTKFADTPFGQLPMQRKKWLVPMSHPYHEMLDAHATASAPLNEISDRQILVISA